MELKCIARFCRSGRTIAYKFINNKGEIIDISFDKIEQLKQYVNEGRITITNLKLTKDNRFIMDKIPITSINIRGKNIDDIIKNKKVSTKMGLITLYTADGSRFTAVNVIGEQTLRIKIPNTVTELNKDTRELTFTDTIRDYKGKIEVTGGQSLENINFMFYDCAAACIDISKLDTSKVKYMEGMFMGCRAGKIEFGNIDTTSVTSMKAMFRGCDTPVLDLRNFEVNASCDSCTNLTEMFHSCTSATIYVDTKKFKVNDLIQGIFYECNSRFVPEEFKNGVIEYAKMKHIEIV